MKILCFGEILFDMFEGMSKIGGAPFNFSAHFKKLGGESSILSAVGKDALGDEAIKAAVSIGVDCSFLNRIDVQTGFCRVTFKNGEPDYDLSAVCAYDQIEVTPEKSEEILTRGFEVLYFGTLAARNATSRKTLEKLLESRDFGKVFFDMNLRQNYFTKELIETSLGYSDIVKINRDEFRKLKQLGICNAERDLCEKFGIEKLLLTLDKDGMVLYDADEKDFYQSQKPKNKVVSTVGAGDASSACFLYNLLQGESPQKCVDRANLMGDYIVTFTEAIPEYSDEFLKKLKE